MKLDFSDAPFRPRAFSEKPMAFIDQAPKTALGAIIDLAAIETGNRAACDCWLQKQLENLLQYAANRSAFWRNRIGAKTIKGIKLSDLPILTRGDLAKQVETERNLLPPSEPMQAVKHATSSFSVKPVQFLFLK